MIIKVVEQFVLLGSKTLHQDFVPINWVSLFITYQGTKSSQ